MWQTVAPDGRLLILRQEGERWIAIYGAARGESGSAEGALRAVLTPASGAADERVEEWISEHLAALDG